MTPLDAPKLSITLWSDSDPAHDRLLAQLHALVPDAQIAPGLTHNQLHVVLNQADATTVTALDLLLRYDFEASVFSYRWYAAPQPRRHHRFAQFSS